MLCIMDKQTFLDEIRASHAPIAAAVAALSDDDWTTVVAGMEGWTRKDVVAHIGWWSDHSARVITALREGRMPYERDPDVGIDARNRSILEEYRGRDASDVRAFEAESFDRLVAAVAAASDDELFSPRRFAWLDEETLASAVEWDSTRHYPDHVAHLTSATS